MSELPVGWAVSTIGQLNEYVTENINPSKHQSQVFELYSVPAYPSNQPEVLTGKDIGSSKQCVKPNDVLLCKINPRINRVWQVRGKHSHEQIASSEWIAIRQPLLDSRFLRYQLQETSFREKLCAEVSGVGGSLTRAQPKKVQHYELHIAPLSEQKRIAQKLDALLAQVDALKARIDAVPAMLKRFRESVLRAAVSGRLTEDWRVSNQGLTTRTMLDRFEPLPPPARYKSRSDVFIQGVYGTAVGKPKVQLVDAWEWTPLVQVARMESGHTPSRDVTDYWNGNVPWIGIKDARINHEKTIYSTLQKTNQLGLDNSAARLLPEGTVCISRTASVGYVVKMGIPMATSQDFVNWVPTDCVDSDWLKWLFVAEKESLFRFGKGTTHTTVYFPEWLSLHVALPHVEEQRLIAARVQSLLDLADRLGDRVVAAQKRIDSLTQSLLAKAFRGELVPQDPNDEPASALLERIRAQRATAPKPKRGRKATTN